MTTTTLKRLNKEDFARLLVAEGLTTTKTSAINIVDVVFSTLKREITAGNQFSLPGFGNFHKFEKQNGTFKPKFTAFGDFKTAVNPK